MSVLYCKINRHSYSQNQQAALQMGQKYNEDLMGKYAWKYVIVIMTKT